MPLPTHPDNGQMRLIYVNDFGCPECGGTLLIHENDVYEFVTCKRSRTCGYEEINVIEHSDSA
jgi:ssDNA-binding Zn-finger/Zn-ribbon topoisomerase 1